MSEDEVKAQAEEPTPEAVEDGVQEEKKIEEKVEKEIEDELDKKANDMEDEEVGEAEEKEEVKEAVTSPTVVETSKTDLPKKEKSVPEETKTPEKGVPLYDQPLEMSGKRDRKKVERFIQEEKKVELTIEGNGTPLGDIPFIADMLIRTNPDELKVLHRVAYGRPGAGSEIRKNLRKFNGFAFTKEDKKFESKSAVVEKIRKSELAKMLKIFGMEVGGSKSDLTNRVMEFLLLPQDNGRKPQKKKLKKGRGRPIKEKKISKDTEEGTGSDSSDEDDNDDDDDEDDNEEEEEEENEENKKKRKRTPAKKTPAKKTPAKKTPAKKTPAKKTPAAKKPAAKTPASMVSSDSDSDSDDEPLAKKAKQPPSDSEIKAMVKKILEGANLEEVTMKSVCRQVYDSYPDFDLAHKKDFIKETVKSIIS